MADVRFVERKVDFFEFKAVGDTVAGRLVKIEPVVFDDGKRSLMYHVSGPHGTIKKFFGSVDLNDKLNPGDIGRQLAISFDRTEEMSRDRHMRFFKVLVEQDEGSPAGRGGAGDEF